MLCCNPLPNPAMTNSLRMYQVDAFSGHPFRGNPAAVVIQEGELPEALMQRIAAENNLSETAFLRAIPESPVADYELRWFTPTHEVELCGHATLASAWVLFRMRGWAEDTLRFHTRSGVLVARHNPTGIVIDLPARESSTSPAPSRLIEALGAEPIEIRRGANWMAVYSQEETIRELQPDFGLLAGLHPLGVIVTAPGRLTDVVSRYFAPSFGIDEDPVTGSAHCDLAPYWCARLGRDEFSAQQVSARGGELNVRLDAPGQRVFLEGQCALYMRGVINVPATAER